MFVPRSMGKSHLGGWRRERQGLGLEQSLLSRGALFLSVWLAEVVNAIAWVRRAELWPSKNLLIHRVLFFP
jgi:hypothetical protein